MQDAPAEGADDWAFSPIDVIPSTPAKLLIIDDVPHNARVLMESLAGLGECYVATSGKKALELVKANPPDLILLDIEMPDMNGYDVLRALKADPETKQTPVIFVTAKSEDQDEVNGLELGAVDFVTKPFWPPIVRARVRNHLWIKFAVERLTDLATRDPLTGAANRREFFELARRASEQRDRYGRPFSLVMFDVDDFKNVNDDFGHAVGDQTLIAITRACRAELRGVDVLGRVGGEEFAVILPETDHKAAIATAEKLRAAIAKIEVPANDPQRPVTASFGVAESIGDDSVSSLIPRADRRLYRAKSEGRNRVVSAE